MSATPSTIALFLRGVSTTCGFMLGFFLLDQFVWHGRHDLAWGLMVAGSCGLLQVARLYRRPEWQAASAPRPVLALGLAGVCVVLVAYFIPQSPGVMFGLRRVLSGCVLLALPLYLVVSSGHQLRAQSATGKSVGT